MTQQQKAGDPFDTRKKDELHAQIDETKSAIAGELRELGQKLSPEHLKEGVKDMIHEAKSEAKEAIQDYKNSVVGSLRTAKDHAIDSVSETMSEVGDRARRAGTATADFVSANAVPLSLIGLGAGWLMLTMRRQRMLREQGFRSYDYYGQRRIADWTDREFDDYGPYRFQGEEWREPGGGMLDEAKAEAHRLGERGGEMMERGKERVEQVVERTKEGASEMRDRVAESASHMRDKVSESAHEMRSRMSDSAHHVRDRMSSSLSRFGDRASEFSHDARERFDRYGHQTVEFAQENPLAISALAVAAGVGFGLLLPSSRIENRLMGPTRGRLMGEARELVDDAKETAQRAAQAAKETVSEVKSTLSSGPSH
jgi:ElaB/YqjD/DUF883 family membrane-anchored ribosome-binding protein